MHKTLNDIKDEIASWIGKDVDIVDHPYSSYRMIKHGLAKITQAYDNFFEVMIQTKEYGTYKTTISYIDVYTNTCSIKLHNE